MSVVVLTRTREFWALIQAVSFGMGIDILINTFKLLNERKRLLPLLFACFLAYTTLHFGFRPPLPYKMQWNSTVEQYLRISRKYPDHTWMIVSEKEEYSIALGKGYHMYIETLLEQINPEDTEGKEWLDYPEEVFIYQQKNIYKVNETNSVYVLEKKFYDERERMKPELEKWLAQYKQADKTDRMSVFYEDENLRVIHISNKKTDKDEFLDIWTK